MRGISHFPSSEVTEIFCRVPSREVNCSPACNHTNRPVLDWYENDARKICRRRRLHWHTFLERYAPSYVNQNIEAEALQRSCKLLIPIRRTLHTTLGFGLPVIFNKLKTETFYFRGVRFNWHFWYLRLHSRFSVPHGSIADYLCKQHITKNARLLSIQRCCEQFGFKLYSRASSRETTFHL